MTSAPWYPGSSGEDAPEEILAALRRTDPVGLAQQLGDLAFLLQGLAGDPAELFTTEGRARREFSDLLGAIQASRGALDSLEARAVIALQETTRRERWEQARDDAAHDDAATPSRSRIEKEADGSTVTDISLITRRSPHMAGRTLASARRLVATLPRIMSALAAGQIGGDAAYAVADASAVLEPDLAREVDRVLGERLPELDGAGTRRWRDAVATVAGELDPEGAALRHRRARRDRHVTMTPGQHGMATLTARLSALDAQQIHRRLSREAERRRAAGDRSGHSAVMADALVDAVLRPEEGAPPVTLEVGVIITDRSLFSPDAGDVAHLEGYGAVPAEAVREQLLACTTPPAAGERDPFGPDGEDVRATLRRLYSHPTADELITMDAASRPFPPAMRRFLSRRDTTCRGPFCNAQIRQYDHIVPVSRGGPTSLDNGQGLCAHCNKKEQLAAQVERVENPALPGHRVRWTGHSGAARETGPTPLRGPSGRSGSSGRGGASGREGSSGPDGTSGLEGLSGPDGTSGLEGLSGPDVTSGLEGLSGRAESSDQGAPRYRAAVKRLRGDDEEILSLDELQRRRRQIERLETQLRVGPPPSVVRSADNQGEETIRAADLRRGDCIVDAGPRIVVRAEPGDRPGLDPYVMVTYHDGLEYPYSCEYRFNFGREEDIMG
ncbi:DUF222 domain-containing protein [Brachybacterium paraconglomeratum]|uniref:DUF222 domain-containing protein n=1 Tax=Brachybacterium paraconglomeratum TaxID=173362 RepID=UPI0022B017A8|nr:DUF222 domain-containing protein [Brachybacterium paraconglomeratum]MCZ4326421.1 DUF222 domain-containing protein [Brachybacterium paraconglomeratum]